MRPAIQPERRGPGRRAGFTLIELLVVISIILVLAALAASATIRYVGVQQQSNTETLLLKVADLLDKHWQAVIDQVYVDEKGLIPGSVQTMAQDVVILPPPTPPQRRRNERRERVIYLKFRLQQEFPETFLEATNPKGLGVGRPSYGKALQGIPPASTPEMERGACLYLALSQSRRGVVTNLENELSSNEIGEDPNTKLKFIKDGWGNPLVLFRWPTENEELNGTRKGHSRDLQDPEGLLVDPVWVTWAVDGGVLFQNTCHRLPGPITPPESFYLPPVVASAGPNLAFGLSDMFMTPDSTGRDNDNLYSFRLRLGARGN